MKEKVDKEELEQQRPSELFPACLWQALLELRPKIFNPFHPMHT